MICVLVFFFPQTLLLILRAVSRANYRVCYKVIDAQHLVPQYRRRIYIIGIRNDLVGNPLINLSTFPMDILNSLPTNHLLRSPSFQMNQMTMKQTSTYNFPEIPSLYRSVRWLLDPVEEVKPRHILAHDKWAKVMSMSRFDTKVNWKIAGFDRSAGTLVTSYRRGYLYNSQFVSMEKAQKWHLLKQTKYGRKALGTSTEVCTPLPQFSRDELAEIKKQDVQSSITDTYRFYTEKECSRIMGFPSYYTLPV